jgi:hypothetical protein
LFEALQQKTRGLDKEFELLREWTKGLGWARKTWWGLTLDEDGQDHEDAYSPSLQFADWKLVDAIFRSRALELPGTKEIVMVPVLDMANHSSGDTYNARFETNDKGDVMLVARDGKRIQAGEEVTIMYGCGGACEMIFSYGFLDQRFQSARELFLSLDIPRDDPLRLAKMRVSEAPPGMRIYQDAAGEIGWESEFVWWACVNEEDGLSFEVLQTNDGQKELKAFWKGREFQGSEIPELLMKDARVDVFTLRSLVLLQQRVEEQGLKISDSEASFEQAKDSAESGIRHATWELVNKLRDLEMDLLTGAYETLDIKVRPVSCPI